MDHVLPERYRLPQNKNTPLHLATMGGHAAVVEKLLAEGADTEAKGTVRGGVRDADRDGSRGKKQSFVSSAFLVAFLFFSEGKEVMIVFIFVLWNVAGQRCGPRTGWRTENCTFS